jgi:DNA-binding transcriptional MerR regulator
MKNERLSSHFLRTCDLARAAGVHVNTVRLYEKWKLIPPVERSPVGYRRFTRRHLDCLLLARLVFAGPYPGAILRRSGVNIIQAAVKSDLSGAYNLSERYLSQIQAELSEAERAVGLLEEWAVCLGQADDSKPLLAGQAAVAVHISKDMLRHWERCGLIDAPRNPRNNYRHYGKREIERLRIIRMLIQTGYSTMSILRMLTHLDKGETIGLRDALDTPRPEEDIFSAADRWLSTLMEQVERAEKIIAFVKNMQGVQ